MTNFVLIIIKSNYIWRNFVRLKSPSERKTILVGFVLIRVDCFSFIILSLFSNIDTYWLTQSPFPKKVKIIHFSFKFSFFLSFLSLSQRPNSEKWWIERKKKDWNLKKFKYFFLLNLNAPKPFNNFHKKFMLHKRSWTLASI